MGNCCPKGDGDAGAKGRDDIASLIRTENLTTEAMRKSLVPPAPLLKDITFAAIIDGDDSSEESKGEAGDANEA
jgi:hypothetical protein